jgi:histidinol-phosphate aminotransferase
MPRDNHPGHSVHAYDPGSDVTTDGWLNLHRNENLIIDRDRILSCARRVLNQHHMVNYPSHTSTQLCELIAATHGVSANNVFVGNGSDGVLADLLGVFRLSNDAINLVDVGFKGHTLLAQRYGYRINTLSGYTFATGVIARNGSEKLTLIDSPNGITGRHFSTEMLLQFGNENGGVLIWDNAYGEIAGDTIPRDCRENLVVVRTFSKFYGLAGLRVGYCVANRELIAELLIRKDPFNVNAVGQLMAAEALRRATDFADIRSALIAGREQLVLCLESYGFCCLPSATNFVLASHSALTAERVQQELAKHRIAVRRFAGGQTDNFIRVTVPAPNDLPRLAEALRVAIDASIAVAPASDV